MKRISLAVLVVATGIAHAEHGARAPSPYEQLFVVGSQWTYDFSHGVVFGDAMNNDPLANAKATRVTCRVTDVRRVASAKVSSITCDGTPEGETALIGDWVMTKRGLWRANQSPVLARDIRALTRTRPLLRAKPRVITARPPSIKDGVGEAYSVTHDANAWCAHEENGEANGYSTWTVCFADGAIQSMESDGTWYGEGGGGTASRLTRAQ